MQENLLPNQNLKDSTLIFEERKIYIPVANPSLYASNKISTCKYNIITFLPKNLFIQFQKLANIYFLIIAFLQMIPEISNTDGIPSILLPLSLVLTVSAIRDLLEDKKRRKSDNEENTRKCLKHGDSGWLEVTWANVRVGDVIKVQKDEFFPADLILCASSDAKGISYVETKSIDGETNLKQKVANKELQNYFREKFNGNLQCEVRCEEPNSIIYKFSGIIKIDSSTIPLNEQQFLIRASSLKNTNWVIGLVVYTGHQSKIMLNSSKTTSKFSSAERLMNTQIVIIFLVQISLCCLCGAYYAIWFASSKDSATYLMLDVGPTNLFGQFSFQFFTWMLNFSNFVPISLLVTLEVVKYSQAAFIMLDLKMYHEESDTTAKVQSCSLNEELGQINYLFSDKTGTLTCNMMEFRKLSINGRVYGTDQRTSSGAKQENVDFVDPAFDPQAYLSLIMHLACCHSVIVEENEYRAASPDELALVSAAKYFGCKFTGRDEDGNMEISSFGEIIKVKVLAVIEFSSDRKRMTVVVEMPDNSVKVLCKGADNIMLSRSNPDEFSQDTLENIFTFSKEGLRTLVLAERTLESMFFKSWFQKYQSALRDIHRRSELIDCLAEEIECQMKIVGVTAIEDKLQDFVPETIQELKSANIIVWVLTGDKIETAVSIGFSCNLLNSSMTLIQITALKKAEIKEQILKGIEVNSDLKALVISGDSLIKVTYSSNLKELIKLADSCKVVLACRVSPQQKADIVKLIREFKPQAKTLSIGDGANDVNMITAAHVGVGISGLEGSQAARASDYSISQFSYLNRLLFVHGRECYRRNTTLICFNFYKNVLLVMPIFFYGFFSVFSGQLIFNTWTYQLFNVTYAALPICVYAVFDREMELHNFNSSHYSLGQTNSLLSTKIFWKWILEAAIQALIVCAVPLFAMGEVSGYEETGHMNNIFVVGTLMYGLIVILVNLKIVLFSYAFYWFNMSLLFLTVVFYFYSNLVLDSALPINDWLDNYEMRFGINQIMKNPNALIVIILVPFMCFFIQPFFKILLEYIELKPMQAKSSLKRDSVSLETL